LTFFGIFEQKSAFFDVFSENSFSEATAKIEKFGDFFAVFDFFLLRRRRRKKSKEIFLLKNLPKADFSGEKSL
jgi:hypothetical protein